jgi:hypothetical protein
MGSLVPNRKVSGCAEHRKGSSKRAFVQGDGTHHNEYGSYELAKCIVEGIKSSKLGITKFLVKDVPPFDPAHPDPPM